LGLTERATPSAKELDQPVMVGAPFFRKCPFSHHASRPLTVTDLLLKSQILLPIRGLQVALHGFCPRAATSRKNSGGSIR